MSGVRAGILGASGYGGAGLIARLMRHEGVSELRLGSRSYQGQKLSDCWPQFANSAGGLRFMSVDDAIDGADVVFCATPHGSTAPLVAKALAKGKRVIDLSADFRLAPEEYERWYGATHPHPELHERARYALAELHRAELPGAELVAVPGCNATAGSLALAPLAAAGLLNGAPAVVTILTGVSGAGRTPGPSFTYAELNENAKAYKPSGTHRHTSEMEATAGRAAAAAANGNGKALQTHAPFTPARVSFTPHLVPMSRGILATVTVNTKGSDLNAQKLYEIISDYYAGDPLVEVSASQPQTKAVAGSDAAHLSAHYDPRTESAVITCAIDNLGKGAAGQAVQAFNLAFGHPETTGLSTQGVWP